MVYSIVGPLLKTPDNEDDNDSDDSDDDIDNIFIKFVNDPSIKQSDPILILLVSFRFKLFL